MTEPSAHIRLNRPRALNSLTLDMVRAMAEALDAFARQDDVAVVLVDGAGERGLGAGGDIRAIYESGRRRDGEAERFLREEYALNARIAAYPPSRMSPSWTASPWAAASASPPMAAIVS